MAAKKASKRRSSVAGNGLFARQDMAAGDLIFALQRPLVTALDTASLASCCINCFASSGLGATDSQLELKACMGCRAVKYCSRTCQSQSWKRHHRRECPVLRELGTEKQLPSVVRAVMQVLIMRDAGLIADTEWDGILSLPDHLDELQNDAEWERHAVLALGALRYSGVGDSFSPTLATCIYARVLINSLTLIGSTIEPLGLCLDPVACSINHSCDANAFVIMDGAQLSLRTLRPIAKDQEIFICYVDCSSPFQRRQAELLQRYHFTCACTKCIDGHGLREDQWLDASPSTPLIALSSLEATAFSKLEQTRSTTPQSAQRLDSIEEGLRFCAAAGVFPVARQPYAAMRDEYILECLYAGRFVDAWLHAVRRYFDVDPVLFPQPHHPLRVVHSWTLAMLTLVVAQDHHRALALALGHDFAKLNLGVVLFGVLVETVANAPASHGTDSAFARTVLRKSKEVRIDMTRGDDAALAGMKTRVEGQWVILRNAALVRLPF